ncbi:MAG: ATP-binding cassette subfamily B protein [Candidatus Paceibacteria bacterium]|jgi:ATP-binding cassette subfamily B protein
MDKFKRVVWYFLPFLTKYKYSVIATFIFYGIVIFLSAVITPLIYKNIIDSLSVADPNQALIRLFIILVVTRLFIFVFRRVGDHIIVGFQTKAIRDIYNFSLNKILEHSYLFFVNNFVGSLVTKTKRFTRAFEEIFDTILFRFYFTAIYLVGMFVVLIRENTLLGSIFLIWVLTYLFVILLLNKKKIPLNLLSAKEDSKVSGAVSDIVTNIFNIKIFSARSQEEKYFENVVDGDYRMRDKKWKFDNQIWMIQGGMILVFELAGMGTALWLWSQGTLSTGTIVLLQIYIGLLGRYLWDLGKSIISFTTYISDSVEFVDIIDQKITVVDVENPLDPMMNNGNLNLEDVSFTYPQGDHVFEKFNLHIARGQSVGVVGKSGSGKTTLTKILLRFYDVDAGEITIDGQNIAKVKQDDLRKAIAYIPQETILFHRSIYENIAYGNPHANHDEVMEASVSAHVDEFVQNLESGYETAVGERGIKLSGGQRQRIGIARAMLKKGAPILVLDEATSSLDSMSEGFIQESFEKLSKNRTTIVIAHRLSTIQKMDRIIVMEHGRIIEDGSHLELLKKNGHYAELWNSQVNGFIPEN